MDRLARVALVVFLAALLAGPSAAGATPGPAPSPSPLPSPVPNAALSGGVYVATLPSGADVWIDGTHCGRSPVLVDALPQGKHAITLTKSGWNVQEGSVDIPGGGVALWSARLAIVPHSSAQSGFGAIVTRGLSHTEKIAIDGGESRDSHGVISIAAGPHTVSFPTAHGRVMRAFTVLPEMTTELVLRDDTSPSDSATPDRVGVIAPANDYLPPEAITLTGRDLLIRYEKHEVVAHLDKIWMRLDGNPVSYNSAPSVINGKLYLPLDLMETLTK